MSFWGSQFWAADYWSADYWSESAGVAPSYVQYPSVELSITPAATQAWAVTWTVIGDPLFSTSFEATQSVVLSTLGQTSDVDLVFSPSSTQAVVLPSSTQSGVVTVSFQFTALQFVGLVQSTDVVFVPTFTANQVVGTSSLSHLHIGDAALALDPTILNVHLLPFSGLEAIATAATVEGYPSTDTTVVLSPAQNVTTENYFEFFVYSNDLHWLNDAGFAGNPVFVEVSFNGSPAISVGVYKSRFVVDPSMGVHTTVKSGLAAKNLNVTLKAYERFTSYVLANALQRPTTILVRGYEERVGV